MRVIYRHRPDPYSPDGAPTFMARCGHRYSNGRYCGRLVYFAERPRFDRGIWKHYPNDGRLEQGRDAMPDGYAPTRTTRAA